MKKLIILMIPIMLGICPSLKAQDDIESIVSGDIEIEGLESFWIECQLINDIDATENFRPARPAGGNVEFLIYTQKYMSRVFSILFNKYPNEMLGMLGTQANVDIDFVIKDNGKVELMGINNGAIFAIDQVVAEKLFSSYRKWRPAKINGEPVASKLRLKIDVSI